MSSKSSKAEDKVQMSTKRVTPNGEFCSPDKLVKQKTSAMKKSPGDTENHGLPGNLVKISFSNKKLTDGSASWSSLPSSLAKLGKVGFLRCSNLTLNGFPANIFTDFCGMTTLGEYFAVMQWNS